MGEFELGSMVTINGPSLVGQVVTVNQRLHSVKQYCVRRFESPSGKQVEDWYYAQELTLRPAEEADPQS